MCNFDESLGSAALEVVPDHDILDVDVPRHDDRLPHRLRNVLSIIKVSTEISVEKVYAEPHLNGDAHPIYLDSCHSIPCYKLLEAHFTVSGTKMTITNKILTNQRRPYK